MRAIRAAPMHVVSGVGHRPTSPRRPRRRPACTDADRGRRARGAGDGGAASGLDGLPRAGEAQRERARNPGATPRPPALRLHVRAKRWRGAGTSSTCLSSALPRRRHAPWPAADRGPTPPRLASVTRSRSRDRASPRGSTVRLFDSRRSTRSGCSPAATLCLSIATIGRSPRSRVWRSARPSARVCPTAGPSSRRRRSSRPARPGDSVGCAGKEAPYNHQNEQQP